MFVSDDARVKSILEQHGVRGVEYKNGMPDFSPFAKGQVSIADMTNNRPHNFSQADELLARQWTANSSSVWTATDVEAWRINNNYSWHELNDLTTMQLVPTIINTPVFKHLGGCSEYTRGLL